MEKEAWDDPPFALILTPFAVVMIIGCSIGVLLEKLTEGPDPHLQYRPKGDE